MNLNQAWQSIKAGARWLGRKVMSGLRWVGIKLGVVSLPINEEKEPAVLQFAPVMSKHECRLPMASFLENNEMAALARTGKAMHGFFKENLNKELFLQYVAYGKEEEADNLLKENPRLLYYADTVTDYAGRRIYGTAYQIALGAEDEDMLAMLQKHFSRLENGRDAMQDQLAAQFPAGEEKAWEWRQRQDSEELRRVVQAIENAPNADACDKAIKAFQGYLDQSLGDKKVIRTGRHFNAQLLSEALEHYTARYEQFGGISGWKNTALWRRVIGYIERHLPACYAQAFSQGIFDIVKNGKALRRSLQFRHSPHLAFFPLDSDPYHRVGYNCASLWPTGWYTVGIDALGAKDSYEAFVRQKQQAYSNYVESRPATSSQPQLRMG